MQSTARAVSGVKQASIFGENTVHQRFVTFHGEFPRVYELFKAFAFELIKQGHKRLGGRMIIERIRWEMATGSKDEQGFKINNDFIAYYTRLFIHEHKQYSEYFETREIKRL